MDKYLLVVLIFLIAGMGISITRSPHQYLLFYTMLGGAIGVILYSSFKARKLKQEENKKRRSKR